MTPRVLVIGGDAAGMSAASTVKRMLRDKVDVVVLEKGQFTSYAACGIPFWVSGEITERDELVARSPEEHRANGLDVRLGVEAVAIDPRARTVTTREHGDVEYDRLVIATGAEPIRPPLPGIDAEGVYGVQSLADGQAILDALDRGPSRVVVVGSGYIGIEMAEACVRRGLDVTVVEMAASPMPVLAPEMADRVGEALRAAGVDFVGGTAVTGFEVTDGKVTAVTTAEHTYPADVVLLGLGVHARSALAAAAGMPTDVGGGIVVDESCRVEGQEHVWSAGDCVASYDRLSGERVHLALGTHANKQGLVAGRAVAASLTGGDSDATFPGVVRTAITRFNDLEIAMTGLNEHAAAEAGFDPVVATIEANTIAHYYPGAEKMTIRLVSDRLTRRLLGGQIVGGRGAGLRIDILAMALWTEMTVDELAMTDLAYAPPFSPVWDPTQMAARAAMRALDKPAG